MTLYNQVYGEYTHGSGSWLAIDLFQTGIQSVYTIEIAPGELTSIAIYDTKENFDAATPEVGKIMGGFAAFFTAPPVGNEGPTIFNF